MSQLAISSKSKLLDTRERTPHTSGRGTLAFNKMWVRDARWERHTQREKSREKYTDTRRKTERAATVLFKTRRGEMIRRVGFKDTRSRGGAGDGVWVGWSIFNPVCDILLTSVARSFFQMHSSRRETQLHYLTEVILFVSVSPELAVQRLQEAEKGWRTTIKKKGRPGSQLMHANTTLHIYISS